MTLREAREVRELMHQARMSITAPGVTFVDYVAAKLEISRGEALSLCIEANKTLEYGEVCTKCCGTGRIKP